MFYRFDTRSENVLRVERQSQEADVVERTLESNGVKALALTIGKSPIIVFNIKTLIAKSSLLKRDFLPLEIFLCVCSV